MNNRVGDCIGRGISHDPCGPCSVRGLSWIHRERSRKDVGLIVTSLVSQDGRTEHYRAGQPGARRSGRLPQGERIHEGMT